MNIRRLVPGSALAFAVCASLATSIAAPDAASAATGTTRVTATVGTTTTLRSTRPTANYSDPGSVIATVKPVPASTLVPTGSVDIAVDGGYFGTYPLDTHARATVPLTDLYASLYPGTYQLTATYSGDAVYPPSTSAPIAQTIVGITNTPVSTLSLNARGLPVFSPRSFRLSQFGPVGCNVNITNTTPNAVALAYGSPGQWKVLRGGVIAAGATKGVGVGLAGFTGYFTTTANTASYIAIRCV